MHHFAVQCPSCTIRSGVFREGQRKRIADISRFLQELPAAIPQYDEQLVRWLVEKAIAFENDKAPYAKLKRRAPLLILNLKDQSELDVLFP